jgi:hypothetical protein
MRHDSAAGLGAQTINPFGARNGGELRRVVGVTQLRKQTAPAHGALKPPTLLRGLPPAERGALRTGGMGFNTPVFLLFLMCCPARP